MKSCFKLLILSILITACEKESQEIQPTNNRQIAHFPNEIGDYWEYEVLDRYQNQISYVKVSVIGDTIIQSDTFKIWEYTGHSRFDIEFVKANSDSALVYDNENFELMIKYLYPASQYEKWRMHPSFDTAYFIGIDTLLIDSNQYEAEIVAYGFNSFNYIYSEANSIQKQIGIVKRTLREYNLWPSLYEEWLLIDSNLLP